MNGLVPQKWHEVFGKVLAKKPETATRRRARSCRTSSTASAPGSPASRRGDDQPAGAGGRRCHGHDPPDGRAGRARRGPERRPAGGGEESDTLVLPGPPPTGALPLATPAEDVDADTTLVLVGESPQEETLLLPAAGEIEDLVAGPTVVMAPAAGSQTLPPEPTVREQAPASETAARPARRVGVPVAWAFGGVAAVAALALGIVGWALWQRSQRRRRRCRRRPRRPRLRSPRARPAGRAGADRRRPARRERAPRARACASTARRRGRRRCELDELPFGGYEVRVEQKGYEPQTRTRVARRRHAERRGARRARAPRGADHGGGRHPLDAVGGDGLGRRARRSGRTPLSGLKLKPGTRRVEVALDGHETWTGSVDVVAGETGRVEVRLKAIAKPQAPPDAGAGRHRARLRELAGRGRRPRRRSSRAARRRTRPTGPAPEVGRAGLGAWSASS